MRQRSDMGQTGKQWNGAYGRRENWALLEKLADRRLEEKPRTAQLLAILAAAVKREGLRAERSQPEIEGISEEVKQDCGR